MGGDFAIFYFYQIISNFQNMFIQKKVIINYTNNNLTKLLT